MHEGRRAAANAACGHVRRRLADYGDDPGEPPLLIGLGSGRTAELFVEALGELPDEERDRLRYIPTSESTWQAAECAGLTFNDDETSILIDIAVDGADEIDPDLALIKGGGGALFREKVVASYADEFVVIGDESKLVPQLGAFPLPIEVSPFSFVQVVPAIVDTLQELGYRLDRSRDVALRSIADAGQRPFLTENGNYIIDVRLRELVDLRRLDTMLTIIPGVIGHGLFRRLADFALVGSEDGSVRRVDPRGAKRERTRTVGWPTRRE